jgi:hypothetical protein
MTMADWTTILLTNRRWFLATPMLRLAAGRWSRRSAWPRRHVDIVDPEAAMHPLPVGYR